MIQVETSGENTGPRQRALPLSGELVCSRCPFGISLRCRRTPTPASYFESKKSIGCRDTRKQALHYEDLQRFCLSEVVRGPSVAGIPDVISVLEAGMPPETRLPDGLLYGVSLKTLISTRGFFKYKDGLTLRRGLRLPPDGRLCLLGTGSDQRLEALWERNGPDAWTRMKRYGFEFATTATFSVWDSAPRFDQIYNQRRNLITYDYLAAAGVPTIPFFFCREDEDYSEVAEWLDQHPEVEVVGGLAQFYRTMPELRRLVADLRYLVEQALPRPVRLLVVGCATKERIALIRRAFPSASIAATKPVRKARSGHVATSSLDYVPASQSVPIAELIATNVCAAAEFLEQNP